MFSTSYSTAEIRHHVFKVIRSSTSIVVYIQSKQPRKAWRSIRFSIINCNLPRCSLYDSRSLLTRTKLTIQSDAMCLVWRQTENWTSPRRALFLYRPGRQAAAACMRLQQEVSTRRCTVWWPRGGEPP